MFGAIAWGALWRPLGLLHFWVCATRVLRWGKQYKDDVDSLVRRLQAEQRMHMFHQRKWMPLLSGMCA